MGFARRFRPTYARANVGHPSQFRRYRRRGSSDTSTSDVVFGAEEIDEQRHHEKDGDDRGEHAAYDDAG
jgi:hypothetical protein